MRLCRILLASLCGSLGACAQLALEHVPPGATSAEVLARAGAPSEERTLPGGITAWYYESGPFGWTTYRTRFDPAKRLLGVEQVLSDAEFRKLAPNQSRREDVLDLFGRPALVTRYPNLGEEVWTYRYRDVTLEMLNDDHFDMATGVLRYYTLYRDPAYTSQGRH